MRDPSDVFPGRPQREWHRQLSVVVPSYNARDHLRRSLETLLRVAPDAEVVVSDGASPDGSAEMVRREFPGVGLVEHPNHGFAFAVNTGVAAVRRRFVLWLNSDLFVTYAALEAMYTRLATQPKVAAVAPRLVNQDGTRQTLFGGFYWPQWVPTRGPLRVGLLSAACLMTRRDVIESVGGLDENLFLYNEEHDWCRRLLDRDFTLELLGEPVVHVGGASTTRSPMLALEARRGFLYVAQKHGWRTAKLMRWAMGLQGLVYGALDPRKEWRSMWKRQHEIMTRGDVLASPFPLSGRGEPKPGSDHGPSPLTGSPGR